MPNNTILKGEYIKVSSKGRFKSHANDTRPKSQSKTIVRGIYPFSNKKLTDFAF